MNLPILSVLPPNAEGTSKSGQAHQTSIQGEAAFSSVLAQLKGGKKATPQMLNSDHVNKLAMSMSFADQTEQSLASDLEELLDPSKVDLEEIEQTTTKPVKDDAENSADKPTLQALLALIPLPPQANTLKPSGFDKQTEYETDPSSESSDLLTSSGIDLLAAIDEKSQKAQTIKPDTTAGPVAVGDVEQDTTTFISTPGDQTEQNDQAATVSFSSKVSTTSEKPEMSNQSLSNNQTTASSLPDSAVANASASMPTNTTPSTTANAMVSAPPTPLLNAQLGSPEWQQALSQHVLMSFRNGEQKVELRLHPEELGSLQITLKLQDNQAQLHIASAHSQVRSAVEAAMPHLRHALAESSINLNMSTVGEGISQEEPRNSQQQAFQDERRSSSRSERQGSQENQSELLIDSSTLQSMTRAVSGIDIFA